MSVIVKGMKMPSNCAHCLLCGDESGRYCAAANEYIPMLGKPKWCPLVEVPTPHGRLVDADAFKACLRNALEQTRNAYSDKGEWAETITEQFCDAIDDQLTIVEAEGGT